MFDYVLKYNSEVRIKLAYKVLTKLSNINSSIYSSYIFHTFYFVQSKNLTFKLNKIFTKKTQCVLPVLTEVE